MIRVTICILALGLCGLACSTANTQPTDVDTPQPPESTTSSAAQSASAAPTGGGKEPLAPVKEGIACGDEVCKKGSLCCLGGDDVRVPIAKGDCLGAGEAAKCTGTNRRVACDDTSDCPTGQACCHSFDESLNGFLECSALPCKRGGEACHGSAKCTEGYACVPDNDWPGYTCVYDRGSVGCGKVTCSGATPICEWDAASKTGKCVARSPELNLGHISCDDHSDCGKGNVCIHPMGGTQCAGPDQYDQSLMNTTIACKTDKDCPQLAWMQTKMVCLTKPELPPTLKVCGSK
jgi:hypothetical protein